MPRNKKLPQGRGPVEQLAGELQLLRRRAGLTYDQMAPRVHFGKTTLATADAGLRFPGWPSVEAYVRACGGDLAYFQRRWRETARMLKAEDGGRQAACPGGRPPVFPDPATAGGLEEYRRLLREVRAVAGDPPYRTLSGRAARLGLHLPRSTVCDMLTGRSRVISVRVLAAYLRACGMADPQVGRWVRVHADLRRGDPPGRADRAQSRAGSPAAAGPVPWSGGRVRAAARRGLRAVAARVGRLSATASWSDRSWYPPRLSLSTTGSRAGARSDVAS